LGWVYPLFEAYPCLKPAGTSKKKGDRRFPTTPRRHHLKSTRRHQRVRFQIQIEAPSPPVFLTRRHQRANVTAFIVFVFGMRYCNGKQELLTITQR